MFREVFYSGLQTFKFQNIIFQFIRKINDPEQIVYARVYLEIKKQFLASHKFNNARNKIKITCEEAKVKLIYQNKINLF